MKPNTLILRTAGTNCDVELAHAFQLAGSDTQRIHLNSVINDPAILDSFNILALPGGFSYGDDISAGRILSNRLRHRLYPALHKFITNAKPIIGICNGFQVLIKIGLLSTNDLPDLTQPDNQPQQQATLTDNSNPRFIDRWSPLTVNPASPCIWTKNLTDITLPIAHGEGRFITDDQTLQQLESNNQIALKYTANPNGSVNDIAGICDKTGLILGLMPHPERYTHHTHHPQWTRTNITTQPANNQQPTTQPTPQPPNQPTPQQTPPGLQFFINAVQHVTQNTPVGRVGHGA